MKKISMAELTGKYVGKSFKACSCMNLLYNWYTDLGIEVPYTFEDLDVKTYFKAWQADKKATLDTMLRLFESLGSPADINNLHRHDLLAVKEKGNIYAAIYLGSNMILTSNLVQGVKVTHLGRSHQVLLSRRLI